MIVDGVFSPLADDHSSSHRSMDGGVSPYLASRTIPESSISERSPFHMSSSQSHGSLTRQTGAQNRLSDQSLDNIPGTISSHSPQVHKLNTELSNSEPSIPQAAVSQHVTPSKTSLPRG